MVFASGVPGRDSDWAGEEAGWLDLWQEEEPEMPEGFRSLPFSGFQGKN